MHTDTFVGRASGAIRGPCSVSVSGHRGKPITMTDDRTDQRAAELLPEERAAGSDDPRAQAEAILADSDRREHDPEPLEERSSDQSAE
jgi:hypothetical protein